MGRRRKQRARTLQELRAALEEDDMVDKIDVAPAQRRGGGEPPAECKRPSEGAWTRVAKRGNAELFDHRIADLRVLSSVDFIPETEGGNGWEYHISVTKLRKGKPSVATDDQVRVALRAFGMQLAGEDNHTKGGVARNFWLPCNGKAPHCDCLDEPPTPMGDGTTGAVTRPDGKDKQRGPLVLSTMKEDSGGFHRDELIAGEQYSVAIVQPNGQDVSLHGGLRTILPADPEQRDPALVCDQCGQHPWVNWPTDLCPGVREYGDCDGKLVPAAG